LVVQVEDVLAQLRHLAFQFEDAFDPGEVDALLLGEPLHLAEHLDVAHRVPSATARRPPRTHEPEPVVLPQSLRVEPRQFCRNRNDVDGSVLAERGVVHGSHAPFARASRSARGLWSAVAAWNRCNASRASLLRFCGTATSTVTSKSPVVPSRRVAPLPRTRNTRPLRVPGGIRTVTGGPLRVGTRTSAPNTASGKVTGRVRVRLSPDRPNTGCGVTRTVTNRSPAGPPRSPGSPLPRSRIRWPSDTPGGMRACTVRVPFTFPVPLQVRHGSSAK